MTSPVRPFRSRLVHPDRARELVTPMVDSVDVPVRPPQLDDTAYDAADDALYVYRQRRGSEEHTGVVCDVHHEAFRDGRVRGHEAVQPDRVAALVRHFATAPTRAELVALLHQPGPVYLRTLAEVTATEPDVLFDGPDGLEQAVWRVPDDAAEELANELGAAVHYVADGHHRVAATTETWRRAGGVPEDGLPCVVYPMDGLSLSAFHRRLPGPVDRDRLGDLLGGNFLLRPGDGPPEAPAHFGVYVDGAWTVATYASEREHGTGGLDVSVLHDRLLEPLVGSGRRVLTLRLPIAELTRASDADDGLLVTVSPPTLDVLIGIADRGDVMPPKSTYFDPKPCAGIFLRA